MSIYLILKAVSRTTKRLSPVYVIDTLLESMGVSILTFSPGFKVLLISGSPFTFILITTASVPGFQTSELAKFCPSGTLHQNLPIPSVEPFSLNCG